MLDQARPGRTRAAVAGLALSYAALVLSAVQGLILVPLALRFVDAATYGAWLATGNVLAWLTFVDPGTQVVLRQRVGEAFGRKDLPQLERAIGTGLLVNALLSAAFVALGVAASRGVGALANAPAAGAAAVAQAFLLAAAAEGVMMLALGFGSVTVALLWYPTIRGALYLFATTAGLGCSVVLFARGAGLPALPLGLLLRSCLLLVFEAALCVFILRRRLGVRPRFSRDELRALLGLSGATWLSRLGGTVLRNLDGMAVAHFAGPAAVTSMTVTRRAMDVVGQLTSRIGSAVAPGIAHLAGERDEAGLRKVSARLLRIAGAVGALGLGGFLALDAAFVRLWVGAGLYAGDGVALAFGLWGLWLGLQALFSETTFAVGGIKQASFALLAESLLAAALLLGFSALGLGLFAPPLGGLLAALALQLYWWRLFQRLAGVPAEELAQLRRELALQCAVAVVLGTLFTRLGPTPRGWPAFCGLAVGFAVLQLSVSLLLSRPLRADLRAALGAVRSRFA